PLDRRVEVDDPERDADDRPDRQGDLPRGPPDFLPPPVAQVERVLEHVIRVEADLLGSADAVESAHLRAEPGRADHPEFHSCPPSAIVVDWILSGWGGLVMASEAGHPLELLLREFRLEAR